MEVFISWSGVRSGACAKALRDWLPCVMQTIRPWCSSEDIAKGSRGLDDIAQNLDKTNFGIVCLTPGNLRSEWINFESGALSKKFGSSALFTFLLDLQPADIKPPLGLFQHTHATREDVLKLVQAINEKTEVPLQPEILLNTFNALWPTLELNLSKLPEDASPNPTTRSEREILEEILSMLRAQSQKSESGATDTMSRRTGVALAFADGFIKGRAIEGRVMASFTEDLITLKMKIENTVSTLEIPADEQLQKVKSVIAEFITLNSVSDDDIPF